MSTTYYIDTRGDDRSAGTSPQQAWRSLEKLKGVRLLPGDQVVLAEGQEFHGALSLPPSNIGTPQKPIVIRGSGAKRATIIASGSSAIELRAGGIEVRDLNLKSSLPLVVPDDSQKNYGESGLRIYTDDPGGRLYKHVRVERVTVSGFSGDGVSVGSWHDSQPGFEDVVLYHVSAHDNGGKGINFYAKRDREKPTVAYPHRNVRITDCTLLRNHSGSGLVLSGVQDSTVEYCLASENTGPGGGVGMWAYDARQVRFHHCIVEGTRTRGKDGGGFDLDGGCVDCTIEHCLTYHNDGPGFMHCDYHTAGQTRGNIIRFCISINDGHKKDQAAFGFGFVAWGSGLDECHVEHNLAIVQESYMGREPEGVLFINRLPGYGGKNDDMHLKGCIAKNNTVVVVGKGVPLVSSNLLKLTNDQVQLDSNHYDARGIPPLFINGKKHHTSLQGWQEATGQERHSTEAPSTIVIPSDYQKKTPRTLDELGLFKVL